MPAFPTLFLEQAQASARVQFVYDPAAGRVVYVNPAYETVLHGTPAHHLGLRGRKPTSWA